MRFRFLLVLPLITFATITLGCDDKKVAHRESSQAKTAPVPHEMEAPGGGGAPAAPVPAEVQRKVIQTAKVDVLVNDFDDARQKFVKLINDKKGYVAKSDFQGNVGAKRSGKWTVRVPVDSFQAFIDATTALGQPIQHSTDAEDVTEEFVDVTSYIKNLKEEEEALNKLLKEKAQSLTDIAAWKEKVSVIRREISKLEARLQTLGRLTAMSTAHVTLRDEKDYVPPTTPVYGSTVRGTFDSSIDSLKNFGKWLLMIGAAILPWLVTVVIPLVFCVWLSRKLVLAQTRK